MHASPRSRSGSHWLVEVSQKWVATQLLASAQLVGQSTLVPLQANGVQASPPPVRAQVPGVVVQSPQGPSHALSQHRPAPDRQLPLAQSPAAVQAWPSAVLHAPAPSQTSAPMQAGKAFASGCPSATLVVQVPAAFAHDLHGVVQASSQHVESAQCPLAQSESAVQVRPSPKMHAPAPSQALVPMHGGVEF